VTPTPTPPDARVVVTGGVAAYDIRDFLTRAAVPFLYLDDEGPADVAVCTFDDGRCLTSPSIQDVGRALGLVVPPSRDSYDLAVIGAGPAGLAAAVYASCEGLATVVVEEWAPGGQAGTSWRIENYLGFPDGISGAELAERARHQAQKFGAEILMLQSLTEGHAEDGHFVGTLADGNLLRARAVLVATGVDWRRLQVAGVDRLLHAGVYYGAAASEAPGVKGKDVFIVGAGNSAGQAALNFSEHARSVTILCRGDALSESMARYLCERITESPVIHVRVCTEVVGVQGDTWLRTITIRDNTTGGEETVPAHALFICIGGVPRTGWAADDGVLTDQSGYLLTGRDLFDPEHNGNPQAWSLRRDPYPLETSLPGLFAAGDVRFGSTKRVASAVGEGAQAVALVHRFLGER
jgi:thioredoxin reductase (NADPH)